MFRSARVKLTTWYLLIVMLISAFFSLIIYAGVASELQGRFTAIERRMGMKMGRMGPPPRQLASPYLIEDLQATKRRVVLILLFTNGVILIVSAAAGYFLAGKTLQPIEKSLEEQKRFVADASHELRTPLTALKTSIEVALRDKKMTAKGAKNVLKSNLEEVDSLESLASSLLSLAQYQKDGTQLTFGPVNLKEVLGQASKKVSPLAKKKSIDLEMKAPNVAIEADEMSLQKLMAILLDNAIKYTPDGGKVAVVADSDRRHLVLKVRDTGIGIAPEDLPHIFDRFYRVDPSRSKIEVSGYGLGLSMAKKIIDLHQGSIGVSSVVGEGTVFTVRLPLKHS